MSSRVCAFSNIIKLSRRTDRPEEVSEAMHQYYCASLNLTRRVQTANLLKSLKAAGVGTNEVELYSKVCAGQSSRIKNRTSRRLVLEALKLKINDADWNARRMRRQVFVAKTKYRQVVRRNTVVDRAFQRMMKYEVEELWKERKSHNSKKVEFLVKKWKPVKAHENLETVRGVTFKDSDIETEVNDRNDVPLVYGGVDCNNNMRTALTLNPKMMTYSRIDRTNMEVEIEKGIVKQRYENMRKSKQEQEQDEESDNETFDLEGKVIDYGRCRATDIPTNPRLIMPKPASIREEAAMAEMKERMLEKVSEYIQAKCNEKGFPESNLSKEEERGVKEVQKKMEMKEIVCFKTDKSGKMSVDSLENYKEALEIHTENDSEVDKNCVEKIETEMNRQRKVFNRMFSVGQDHPRDKDRIDSASTSTNVPAPVLYGMRKDHKEVPEGQESKGPPVRPVCAAKVAPNSRLSGFLTQVINDYCDGVNNHHEVKSSEEMRAAMETFNENVEEEVRRKCKILSFDVKSLYPRTKRQVAATAVKQMVMESNISVNNVNYKEVGKYLRVMMTEEEVQAEGLEGVLPKRVKKSRRVLTTNCLFSSKPESEEWIMGSNPSFKEMIVMIANALSIGVKVVMSNHTYTVGEKIFLQSEGCPIGLDLSQAVARAVMMQYDKLYLEKVAAEGIKIHMYTRYVDDSNQVVESDAMTEEQIAGRLKDIANTVLDGIEMESDLPCRHYDKKMPILDMKCWIGEDGFVKYIHYEKPMASKQVIPQRSAHSSSSKRSVHVSEIVRRCLNTSRRLEWSEYVVPVLDEYMLRMKKAGYHEAYRRDVLINGINIFEKKTKDSDEGLVPLNRPSGYKKVERRKDKRWKSKNWNKRGGYGAPIIVPATPNSELARMLREVVESQRSKSLRFKIVEKGGKTIERRLMTSNPIGDSGCKKDDCPACKTGNSKLCHVCNVCYTIKCKPCADAVYYGESHRNLYSRGKEHEKKLEKKDEGSFMFRHQVERHDSKPVEFEMKVVKSFRDPLSRQVTEAILIKNHQGELLNSKSEFHQPSLIRIHSEIVKGLDD